MALSCAWFLLCTLVSVSAADSPMSAPGADSRIANAGAVNAACPDHAMPPRDPHENPRSTGVVVRYGEFRRT
jgi:hypothetical protein